MHVFLDAYLNEPKLNGVNCTLSVLTGKIFGLRGGVQVSWDKYSRGIQTKMQKTTKPVASTKARLSHLPS